MNQPARTSSERTSSERPSPGSAARPVLSRTFEVDAGGHCRLDVPHADVTLTTGAAGRAEVTVTAADPEAAGALVESMRLRARYAEGTLRVEPDAPPPRSADWWRQRRNGLPRLHLDVRVPAGFGATVHAPGGAVEASGLEGTVTLDVTGGRVRATGLRGRLDLYAHHSRAVVENFDGKKLTAHVQGSTLAVRGARAEAVEVESAAAELLIEGVKADVHLAAQSGAANLRDIEGPLDAKVRGGTLSFLPEANAEATIRAPGSRVRLSLPSALAAELRLSADRLLLENLLRFDGEQSERHAEGNLRGGGPLIEVHAPGGTLECE